MLWKVEIKSTISPYNTLDHEMKINVLYIIKMTKQILWIYNMVYINIWTMSLVQKTKVYYSPDI